MRGHKPRRRRGPGEGPVHGPRRPPAREREVREAKAVGWVFQEAVEYFIMACPGPFIAEKGLRIVAYQRVRGISGLDGGAAAREHLANLSQHAASGRYIASIARLAPVVRCRPAYLSQSALRRGYSYSRALRWIRFFHCVTLQAGGVGTDLAVRRTGFSDPGGWTRFTRSLTGKSPQQLPQVPLEFWARRAVEDVYLGGWKPILRGGPLRDRSRGQFNAIHSASSTRSVTRA